MLANSIKPWYGTWPPEIHKEEAEMESKHSIAWHKWPIVVLGLLISGILIALPLLDLAPLKLIPHGFLLFLSDVGKALLAATVIGTTLNWVFGQRLIENVFKASVGYLLPEYLRPEMQWIYGQTTVAENFFQEYELTPLNGDLVLLSVSLRNTIQNVSNSVEKYRPALGIDEWFHGGRNSQILEFGYSHSTKRRLYSRESLRVIRKPFSLSLDVTDDDEVELSPNDEITVWFKFEELKRTNDATFFITTRPIRKPLVKVNAPDELGIHVAFAHREKQEQLESNVYRLNGTLLPFQHIQIRWWIKADSKEWQKGHGEG